MLLPTRPSCPAARLRTPRPGGPFWLHEITCDRVPHLPRIDLPLEVHDAIEARIVQLAVELQIYAGRLANGRAGTISLRLLGHDRPIPVEGVGQAAGQLRADEVFITFSATPRSVSAIREQAWPGHGRRQQPGRDVAAQPGAKNPGLSACVVQDHVQSILLALGVFSRTGRARSRQGAATGRW